MKIRSDFVTNSSSSSFVVIEMESEAIARIILGIAEELEEYMDVSIDGNIVKLCMDEGDSEHPKKLKDVVDCLAMFLDYEAYYEIKGKSFDESSAGDIQLAVKELMDNKKEISDSIENVEWINGECGYGGDDDSRYYSENYTKKQLKALNEIIAAQNGVTVDEVTDEMFGDYVADKSSNLEIIFKYCKETNRCRNTKNMELL